MLGLRELLRARSIASRREISPTNGRNVLKIQHKVTFLNNFLRFLECGELRQVEHNQFQGRACYLRDTQHVQSYKRRRCCSTWRQTNFKRNRPIRLSVRSRERFLRLELSSRRFHTENFGSVPKTAELTPASDFSLYLDTTRLKLM